MDVESEIVRRFRTEDYAVEARVLDLTAEARVPAGSTLLCIEGHEMATTTLPFFLDQYPEAQDFIAIQDIKFTDGELYPRCRVCGAEIAWRTPDGGMHFNVKGAMHDRDFSV